MGKEAIRCELGIKLLEIMKFLFVLNASPGNLSPQGCFKAKFNLVKML